MQAQDVYSISVLPEEGENANRASPVAFLSIVGVPNQAKSTMSLDAHINCQKCIDFQMKEEDMYSQCVIDMPNVNGNSVSTESYEEGVESFKTGNSPTVSLINTSCCFLRYHVTYSFQQLWIRYPDTHTHTHVCVCPDMRTDSLQHCRVYCGENLV